MQRREAIEQMLAEVLDGTELRLMIDAYKLEEQLETGEVQVQCNVHHQRTGEKKVIEGRGVGIVDAVFHGLVELYSPDYPSLNTIRFEDFAIKANVDSAHDAAKSDMAAQVSLRVANSEGHDFVFTHDSRSITQSCVAVVLQAVGFFLNCERAFIAVYRALEHARKENRADSIQRYTAQLVTLVEATSYSEVIEQIRNSEPGLKQR